MHRTTLNITFSPLKAFSLTIDRSFKECIHDERIDGNTVVYFDNIDYLRLCFIYASADAVLRCTKEMAEIAGVCLVEAFCVPF